MYNNNNLGTVQGLREFGPEVREESHFESTVRDIHEVITSIENALEVVLSPSTPEPADDRPANNKAHVQVNEVLARLRTLRGRIHL